MSFVLDWAMCNVSCEEAHKVLARDNNFTCKGNNNCVNSDNNPGFHCNCYDGYEGNPYLSPGCQDVNECKDENNGPCVGVCTNTKGRFRCTCPKGTFGDERKVGDGCSATKQEFPSLRVTLGIGLGLLFLIIGLAFLYIIKKRNLIKLKDKFFEQNGCLLLRKNIPSSEGGVESTKIYTAKELELATNNYDAS